MKSRRAKKPEASQPTYKWALPDGLDLPADNLALRLDFYSQSIVLSEYGEDGSAATRMVSATDIAHALASSLSYSTGILPPDTLWWRNTRSGPWFALYEAPRVRRLALQTEVTKEPERFNVPLPGLIFLCTPGQQPWVYAVKSRPAQPEHEVFKAPLANVYNSGRTCPGNNRYPQRPRDIVESFFESFFTPHADIAGRSNKHPKNITELWRSLDGKDSYPLKDLIRHGTVRDLMNMDMEDRK